MRHWMLNAGGWMIEHHGVVITGVVLMVALVVVMMRRRRARKPMKWIDLTGTKCLAVPAIVYDREMVDAIADRSFATGMFVGGLLVVAMAFLVLVWCMRGQGNRSRNGRGVS